MYQWKRGRLIEGNIIGDNMREGLRGEGEEEEKRGQE